MSTNLSFVLGITFRELEEGDYSRVAFDTLMIGNPSIKLGIFSLSFLRGICPLDLGEYLSFSKLLSCLLY